MAIGRAGEPRVSRHRRLFAIAVGAFLTVAVASLSTRGGTNREHSGSVPATTAVTPRECGDAARPNAPAPSACEAGAGELSLPRIPWEAGPAYWGRFPKASAAGWTDPTFFPIAVYYGKPEHAASLRSIGVNTYLGVEHDSSTMRSITETGMFVIAQEEWTPSEIADDPGVVGNYSCDEPDMGSCGGSNEAQSLAAFRRVVQRLRARDDGRFVFANFGNGVLRTFWMPTLMPEMVREVDASTVDKYAYTSPHVQQLLRQSDRWPDGVAPDRSATYGWLADHMRSFLAPDDLRPTWVFVETARPLLTEEGARVIRSEEIEGAVWSAIIHEARGIAYFEHSNDPACASHHSLVDCPELNRETVRRVNAKIRMLAPVLNTQSYVHDFANGTDTMLKTYDGSAYIFAGIGLQDSPGVKRFILPAGIDGTSVTVVGEDRTIDVSGRSFTDEFEAEHTSHVYRIEL